MIDFTKIVDYIPFIVQGVMITIQLALVGAFGGSILGFVFGLTSRKKNIMGYFVRGVIDFFRGTPIAFQLAFFHYGMPQLIKAFFGISFVPTAMFSASVIFVVNSSSYLAEILRAGIESIDKGQIEAAKALGVKSTDYMMHIIIPQAIRNVLPAIVNEFITLTKETSIASLIGVSELMRRATIITGTTFRYFEPLLIVGITYYVLNKMLSTAGKYVEKRLKYD
jgi:His/Glu/Gln/Arg/opine family amino acid ABC transporter permease subunit